MATRQEIKAVAESLRNEGHRVAMMDSANFYANSLESAFSAAGRDRGPRADVLLLQCVDHSLPNTLAVVRVGYLRELLAL
jgi:hypothetical protein